MLLYGPPGTGKTLYAKKLARETNLHYAIMSGGDVAPLGSQATYELNKGILNIIQKQIILSKHHFLFQKFINRLSFRLGECK